MDGNVVWFLVEKGNGTVVGLLLAWVVYQLRSLVRRVERLESILMEKITCPLIGQKLIQKGGGEHGED